MNEASLEYRSMEAGYHTELVPGTCGLRRRNAFPAPLLTPLPLFKADLLENLRSRSSTAARKSGNRLPSAARKSGPVL